MVKKTYTEAEKVSQLEEHLLEVKEPQTLKELQVEGPKRKPGLRFPLIKGFCETLVSEDRIQTDKIGSSTYFWAFPSAKTQRLKRKRDQLDDQEREIREKITKLRKDIEEEKKGKEDSDDRISKIEERTALEEEVKRLDAELSKYHEFDPEVIDEIKQNTEICKEAAERWTNNIFETQSFWSRVLFKDMKEYNKMFSWIPEDIDFLA